MVANFTNQSRLGDARMSRNRSYARRFRLACAIIVLACGWAAQPCRASQAPSPKPGEPADPKAHKTFQSAQEWERSGNQALAIEAYRKANAQDGGHCGLCLKRAHAMALAIGDFKTAEAVLRDWLPAVTSDAARATLHFQIGIALQREGIGAKGDKQRDCFEKSLDEFRTALSLDPTVVGSHFGMGIDLAYLHQDDAAREEFRAFLDKDKSDEATDARAARFLDRVELARSRMAPAFTLTTLDGQHISMDNLAGKVVLIDFWATWCGPCRDALPHIRRIAQKFQGQPFVMLSVSLDSDAAKWKDFVAKNEMTWLQYRDGGFEGSMAKMFSVEAIPATFSIDADGVLEDQHVGDENIEGKLKKMIAHAVEMENAKPAPPAASQTPGSGN
jgi:thiol-disulfide isomerase/thioredoxin